MKDINAVEALRKQLADGKTGKLYVFYGEELYLLEHYLREMQKRLLPEGMEIFNLDKLAGDATFAELRDAVWRVPAMCERRLVLVRDYDLFKQNADTRKQLEGLLSDLPDTSCLVFYYELLEYKKDNRQKLAEVLEARALEVQFARQEEERLYKWLRRHLKEQGKDMGYAEAQYLIFRCGADMLTLKQEIDKLAAFAKEEAISKRDIDAVVVPALEARVFDMCSALASGKTGKAAAILLDLAALRTEPLDILGALSWQLRSLYAARLITDRRLGASEYAELTKSRSRYQAGEMLKLARGRTIDWCRKAVLLCFETDKALKSLSFGRERELELFLARLA